VSYSADVTVRVTGTTVRTEATFRASRTVRTSSYSVCVRTLPDLQNRDFPHQQDATLSRSGTTFTATQTLPAGTYQYYGCVQDGRGWHKAGPTRTFGVQGRTPTPTPTPIPTPTPSPTDPTAPPVDIPGWQPVFVEDFTTPAPLGTFRSVYAGRWIAYDNGWPDTSGRGTYAPDKVLSVSDGVLDWYVHTANGKHNVAAMVSTLEGSKGHTYGRYSVRFRADSIPGYKMVVILWPDSDNWGEGEIDFPEVGELTPDQPMCAFLHGIGAYSTNTDWSCTKTPAADSGWHTATIEWEPGKITYILDGTTIGTHTSKVPNTSFHFVFQVETNLSGSPIPDSSAGHIQVDWVTIHTRG
jgi:hypothetical protein